MATARRIKRLQQMILQAAAKHVHQELDDPRLGVVSITRVKLSPDLSHGQIFWSCLGDEGQVRTTERGLEGALASIQRAVAGALQTRTTPRLELLHDNSLGHAQRLDEIFTQLRNERGEDEPTDEGDASRDDASQDDASQDDASQDDASQDDASQDDASQDDASQEEAPEDGDSAEDRAES